MEKLWGFEGVTPEMLRRQRDQASLLQRLVALANDKKALEIALQRSGDLIDRDFFALLDQLIMAARAQGQANELQLLVTLRTSLLDTTPAGKELKVQQERIRGLLAQITPQTTRGQLLDLIVDAWKGDDGQQVVGTLAVGARGLFDYEFLMRLAERIDVAPSDDEKEQLEELRSFLLELQQQLVAAQRESQEAGAQRAQAVMQEVLQATDMEAALRAHIEDLDETFLAVLAANAQQAERNNAKAAARRLRSVYEAAVKILQENMPQDLRLLNQLLSAPDEASTRQLLRENRDLLTQEFLDTLKPLEAEMREGGRPEIADRIKSLRAQITLMR
jgi:hypothetical protein